MNRVVIGIGSNIDPVENVARALEYLEELGRVAACSPLVKTAPLGTVDQPEFLNGAALLETSLSQADVTQQLRDIEERLGRIRGADRNGPRTIDLDLVIWNDTIEDRDVHQREFLKTAVLNVRPDLSERLGE